MQEKGYFVTGIDTNAGKTWVTLALMRYWALKGDVVAGMKPVASGCDVIEGELRNPDAVLIQQQNTLSFDYDRINPYAYELAVSPHIAGKANPAVVDVILREFKCMQRMVDKVIVEGAGGWFSPLSETLDNAALAKQLDLPVIVTVPIRLGCINHARLALAAIRHSSARCAGWIAVCNDQEMLYMAENIAYLVKTLTVPMLGVMPYQATRDVDALAAAIVFPVL